MSQSYKTLIFRYIPQITSIPMCQGIRWMPSWKAGESACKEAGIKSLLPFELNWAMYNYSDFRVTRKSKAQIAPFPIFRFPCWSHHVRYPYDASTNQMISDWSLRESDSFLRDMSTYSDVLASHSRAPGRLAFSTSSGAGKRRIFDRYM